MNFDASSPKTAPAPRASAAMALLALGAAALITACGGGGDSTAASASAATDTTERATAYASGTITGLGSIIVNGIRYDDSGAAVSDDDGRARSRELLKLGMAVEVDASGVDSSAATGRALKVRYGSELVGPVSAVDAAAGTLVLLGQNVDVSNTTVFDSSLSGGLAGVTVGSVLEVHAQYAAATGRYSATRIEAASSATTYKLRGSVAALDTTLKTFNLGGQAISYANVAAADLPSNLADGLTVRVRLETTAVAGTWVATSVRSGVRRVEDRAAGHLRGAVTVLTSSTDFEIDGLKVDATAASFPDGSAGVVLGAMLEVHGALVNGVLVATRVELDSKHAKERHGPELHGTISALNTAAKTFVLRGVTVNYAAVSSWKNGLEANLLDGARVEVKGSLSADKTQLSAVSLKFES